MGSPTDTSGALPSQVAPDPVALAVLAGHSWQDILSHAGDDVTRPDLGIIWYGVPTDKSDTELENAPAMVAPNSWTTDQSGNNPWVAAGNAADQQLGNPVLPGTADTGELKSAPPDIAVPSEVEEQGISGTLPSTFDQSASTGKDI